MNKIIGHSIELVKDLCIGCTNCIKRCPTEAIRVRNGKAIIRDELCIDCGMCVRVCRSKAKRAVTDSIDLVKNYNYRIALPAPSLYSQFKNIYNTNIILTAVKRLGFDEVFEVSSAAELVTKKTKEYLRFNPKIKKPVISSACPVIIRLITMRFPELLENILPILSPMEISAQIAKNLALEKGIKEKDIGIFFISPCAAKKTNTINPLGIDKSNINGVISISDIYMKLMFIVKNLKDNEIEKLSHSTHRGMNWALSGGESRNIRIDNAIAVDGMDNVIKLFEEIENGRLTDVEFIEALSCTGGCVGGPLTIDNSFVAKNTLKKMQNHMAINFYDDLREININNQNLNYNFTKQINPLDSLKLDEDVAIALKKMAKIEEIFNDLPSVDCGACGAPTCKSLAEDIVQGSANKEDCIFMLRKRIKNLAEEMVDLTSKLPQTYTEE